MSHGFVMTTLRSFSGGVLACLLGLVHYVNGYDASLGIHLFQDRRPNGCAATAQRAGFDDKVGLRFNDDLLRNPYVVRILLGEDAKPFIQAPCVWAVVERLMV